MLYRPVTIGSAVQPLSLDGNIFLAPVAGYSDRSFRSICVDCGASFTYTEMVSAEALVRRSDKTHVIMRRAQNERLYAVQIFGSNPETISRAVAIVLDATECSCLDINCGCPVPKIIKTGAGSALIRNPDKLHDVVSAAVAAAQGRVPVTVKIRSGWDAHEMTWKEAAGAALDAGVSAITIHPRTRAQGYGGKADWNIIAALVEFVAGRVPVFGSGDLFTPEDARDMLLQTGCDAVMFARGAMGNPFIFTETTALLKTGSYSNVSSAARIAAGFKELQLLTSDVGEERACKEMRKRFCAYTKGIAGGAELRNRLVHAATIAEYNDIVRAYV